MNPCDKQIDWLGRATVTMVIAMVTMASAPTSMDKRAMASRILSTTHRGWSNLSAVVSMAGGMDYSLTAKTDGTIYA